jgi:RNA polymerase subunit RPABC4/transcription elongation factor Spt4
MNVCTICGRSLGENARFCPACGNPTAPVQVGSLEPEDVKRCTECGSSVIVGAQFCPTCGSTLQSSDAESVRTIAASLESMLVPLGTTVLLEVPGQRKNKRAEMKTDQFGRFTGNDRMTLERLLNDLIYSDAYLHSEVLVLNGPAHCVWHVIAGGVFPLESVHAEFVLFYFDSLLPKGLTEIPDGTVADAPPIFSLD